MYDAIKIRLYPTCRQQELLAMQFGCARWTYNNALAETQRLYRETGKGLSYAALSARLTTMGMEFPWLAEAPAQPLQQSLRNLSSAFQNFFERRSRYPRFKSKDGRQSIQYPQNAKLVGDKIRLPKIGWVKCVAHRTVIGDLKTVTVSKNASGHYYAAILTDDKQPTPQSVMPEGGKFTGVDVGLVDFAVTGKGQRFGNPRHLQQAEKNLARKQSKLDRKKKGSNSREKARKLVARAHDRVANTRKDYQHKLSRRLIDENQAIAVEDLNVKGMLQHPTLAKAISDAGWGMFLVFCQYKAERAGKYFVRTNRYFPTSKACSNCGAVVGRLRLDCRRWTCQGCGCIHDRDENAAKNIGQEADRMFAAGIIKASGVGASAGGGDVSHARGRKSSVHAVAVEAGNPTALATG